MKSLFALTALSLALTTAVWAQATPSSAVEGGNYTIEPMHTRVMFSVDHMGFTTYYGQFTGASGTLQLNPKAPATSTFSVKVPTDSVTTTNTKLDGELKSKDWLDAAKYPAINFIASQVTPVGPAEAKVTGDLTLHGVTRPVTLDVKYHGAGTNPMSKAYTVGFDLTGHIKRSDFGVKTYLPMIGNDVDLTISAAFEKKSS